MNCDEVQVQLSGYVDEELSQAERRQIDLHLHMCPECRQVLSELNELKTLFIDTLSTVNAPADMERSVISQIQRSYEVSHRTVQLERLSLIYGIAAVAGGLLITLIVLSPIGLLIRAVFRLSSAIIGGVFALSGLMGAMWIAMAMVFFTLLAGLSVFGVFRLLRSERSEVLL